MNEAVAAARSVPQSRSRGRMFALAGSAALVLASVGLFLVSRGKWSDAIIDSGREWIVPDALARGDLLYRDVVYWFGPFTPYFHAAFFKLFGSSFVTLVAAGVVGSIGVLAALYFALTTVTGRREAALWTALAIPALIFMPNAGGSILGMGYRIWHAAGFALAAIGLASRRVGDRRPILRAVSIGLLCAFAGLCRTEWGLATALVSIITRAVALRTHKPFLRQALLTGGVYLLTFFSVVGGFIVLAGTGAVLNEGHLLLTGLPKETRTFLLRFSGITDWRAGFIQLAYSAAMWIGVFFLIEALALWRRDSRWARRRFPGFVLVSLVLLISAVLGGATGAVLFSAAPFFCLLSFVIGVRRVSEPRAAALVGFGLLGATLFYRRVFHIGDSAYVGPPLLFSLVATAGIIRVQASRFPAVGRAMFRRTVRVALAVLTAGAFLGRIVQYRSDDRVTIEGTDGMLSAQPQVASQIARLAQRITSNTEAHEAVVIFPEGELVNYVAMRPNPLRHKLYIPGYLNSENEALILAELERFHPEAIVVWYRPTGEYGAATFGEDYGRAIWRWIEDRYSWSSAELRPFDRRDRFGPISRIMIAFRRR